LVHEGLLLLHVGLERIPLLDDVHDVGRPLDERVLVEDADGRLLDTDPAGAALDVELLQTSHEKVFETLQVYFMSTFEHHYVLLPVHDALAAEGTGGEVLFFDLGCSL